MIEKTQELLSLLSKNFFKLEIQGFTVCVNALTISINTFPTNSNILLQRTGTGKSELLRCLAKSNKKYFFVLPERLYESSILEFNEEVFRNKVWIHDDLIVAFHGLTTKQRQQLMGFFVEFLSQGKYIRKEKGKEYEIRGRVSCIFPLSSENYAQYGRQLFYATLVPERLVPIGFEFKAEDMAKAGALRLEKEENDNRKDIKIKLPFTDEKIDVKLPQKFHKEICHCAMRLQLLCKLSATRGVKYVSNWLKAHALLNDREYIEKIDLEIFKNVLPCHSEPRESLEAEIRRFMLNKILEQGSVSSIDIYRNFREYPGQTIRKVLKNVKRDCPWRTSSKKEIIFYLNY